MIHNSKKASKLILLKQIIKRFKIRLIQILKNYFRKDFSKLFLGFELDEFSSKSQKFNRLND